MTTPVLHINSDTFDPNDVYLSRGDVVVVHNDVSIPGMQPTWQIHRFFREHGEPRHTTVVATGECGCP